MANHLVSSPNSHSEQHEQSAKRSEVTFNASAEIQNLFNKQYKSKVKIPPALLFFAIEETLKPVQGDPFVSFCSVLTDSE